VGGQLTDAEVIAATVGNEYTTTIHARGVGDFEAGIEWLRANKSSISLHFSAAGVTGDGTATVSNSITATAPADTVYMRSIWRRTTNSALTYFAGAINLCNGDYDRAHLPSNCPGLIEFGTAPAATERVTCTAEGNRISRCEMLKKGAHTYVIRNAGITKASKISFTEVAEGAW